MKIDLDYSISDKTESIPVGYIKFLYSGEIIDYYSEKELLEDFEDIVYSEGVNSIKYKINRTKENPRHGLKYELLKAEADEYGQDYTKEEYERAYKKSVFKKLENKLRQVL